MRHLQCACLLVVSAIVVSAGAQARPGIAHANAIKRIPITTSSKSARRHFESAMMNLEEIRTKEALQGLRAATKADPNFGQAFIMIAHVSRDPEEQARARATAESLAPRVSKPERLLIRWLAGVQEGDYIQAIAAMNDLLSQYPRDQRLAFLVGAWFVNQERYSQAIVVLETAVTLDPQYAAALNELAYAYAFSGSFEKAFATMDRYVALQPDQPNPHDSYGEILRLAGRFEAALEEYRASIRIDPNFGSELGVADTYAVMGKEQEARDEYERAIVFAGSEPDKVAYELQMAITWIREGNRKEAERALREVGRHAHRSGLAKLEAETLRVRAMYEADYKDCVKNLQAARLALEEHRLSRSDHDDEQALILKVEATRAAQEADFRTAESVTEQLEEMATNTRSQIVLFAWHTAAGATLAAQGKYPEAISHLEEDTHSPLSMQLLWDAYEKTGAAPDAQALATKLAAVHEPTIEQALIVPNFRANLVSEAQHP
ncbi:MAG TPA: tetratricopeptide repeat protein [Terriglobales bacterium]|jgi:tetratricopeptide (TPR) repeat protein